MCGHLLKVNCKLSKKVESFLITQDDISLFYTGLYEWARLHENLTIGGIR